MPDEIKPEPKEVNKAIKAQIDAITNPEEVARLNEIREEEYLAKIREKNKRFLIKLTKLEKERIASKLKAFLNASKTKHQELENNIDGWDETFRMVRKQPAGTDESTPNYVTPLSTISLEVIHANIMNVFFTPKDTLRILPTEEGDIPKIQKLDTFGNWSMKNELKLFEQCDRLFHSSGKNGECPYIVHWVKEYGVEIKREPLLSPIDETPLIDPDTKEVLFQEREQAKLLYNGPKLVIFSRKDYILPESTMADQRPPYEFRRIRMTSDEVLRAEKEATFYDKTHSEIKWAEMGGDTTKIDKEGQTIPLAPNQKEFYEFYGRLRIDAIKLDDEDDLEELETEFIATFDAESETLCALRKNKFPLQMRPIGMDEFIPDDEGRRAGTGVFEFMDSLQKANDALFNQFIQGTINSNNPFGFFSPTGNMRDEPIKAQQGYLYPSSDPNSINMVTFPPPDITLQNALDRIKGQAQALFGIGDYMAGIESTIDPTAPARKAEIVVAQGNVRTNLIIKRKNKTLKDIFKRWFLLYQANMPPNKFMRIAGEDRDRPWKFEKINLTDFALNSIPDFELTGNVLNANKRLEAQNTLSIYSILLGNPFFSAQSQAGIKALHALTKWFLDKLDETGVSSFLPVMPGDVVQTPEEENARFLQGDIGEPAINEDHINHIRVHSPMLSDVSIPEEIRKNIQEHIQKHVQMMNTVLTMQMTAGQQPITGGQGGEAGLPRAGGGVQGQGLGAGETRSPAVL